MCSVSFMLCYRDIINLITCVGKILTNAFPVEAPLGNMVRRVLKIIREEYVAGHKVYKNNLFLFTKLGVTYIKAL